MYVHNLWVVWALPVLCSVCIQCVNAAVLKFEQMFRWRAFHVQIRFQIHMIAQWNSLEYTAVELLF